MSANYIDVLIDYEKKFCVKGQHYFPYLDSPKCGACGFISNNQKQPTMSIELQQAIGTAIIIIATGLFFYFITRN